MERNQPENPGYKRIIETQTRQVFDASISTKIFQHINRVRDASHEGQARRWIWELIQNAKDAAYGGTPACIRVVYTGDTLKFSHTGRPFGIKNVLSIINQVSSKTPDDEETTGKFGTGFITTHLLSERVALEGVIQDKLWEGGQELLLPYKPFTVMLDRSGATQEEILAAVNVAVNVISNLDSAPDIQPEVGGFHTTFTYFLTTSASKKIAQIGMEDLRHSIIYALAFTPGVAEITLENQVEGTSCRYSSEGSAQVQGISLFQAIQCTCDTTCFHSLLVARQGHTALATPVEDGVFLPISDHTPRLFADFPLVGSEGFPFPVVCNNRNFLPDELRSGLPLSANLNSVNSAGNKEILQEAVTLYKALVCHCVAQGYRGFYHMARLGDLPQRPDLDASWVTAQLYGQVLDFLYTQPVVETAQGMGCPAHPIYFPHAPDEEERTAIAQALALRQLVVPVEGERQGWYQAFCGQAVMGSAIEPLLKSGEPLLLEAAQSREGLGEGYIDYLQKIYNIALKNPALRPRVEGGEIPIFPDQTPEITLRTASELYLDQGLDEPIKKAIEQLDEATDVGYSAPKHIYQSLLHPAFDVGDLATVHPVSVEGLFTYIEQKLEFSAHRLNHSLPQLYRAAVLMVSCYNTPYWIQLARTIYPNDTADLPHSPTKLDTRNGWRNAIILLINLAERRLGRHSTVAQIQETYLSHGSEAEVYPWLSAFYQNAFQFTNYLAKSAIFPNQRGALKSLQGLYQDEGIHETLKDILEGIAKDRFFRVSDIRDYRALLLHRGITAFPTANCSLQSLSNGQMASDITRHITALLNQKSLSEAGDEMQDACTQLLAWIQSHEGEAQGLFTAFYPSESRMKLLTIKAAARMTQELSRVNGLMTKYGVSDLEEVLQAVYEREQVVVTNVYQEGDVYVEYDGFEALSREEQMAFARRVGTYGEGRALVYLQEKWEGIGYELATQTPVEVVLCHPETGDMVTLSKPDSRTYHQAGWDISETVVVGEETQPTHYYEVKSTVAQKRKNLVRLSHTQAKFAMEQGRHYTVMSLFLPKTLDGLLGITLLPDVVQQIQQGTLALVQNELLLLYQESPAHS